MILSVVIPCWCEAPELDATVRAAAVIADEVIVVDAVSPCLLYTSDAADE